MRTTIELLTSKERELLAHFYDSETYKAQKKLLEAERVNTATKLLDVSADDVVTIARHQGRADMAKQLHLTLKANFTHTKKES